MVTADDVRAVALTLPRTTEHIVRDSVRFRVGRLVYVGFSPDELFMGVAFPKEERAQLVAQEPDRFFLPPGRDLRYNWVIAHLAALDDQEMRQRVTEAWTMVVPGSVARAHLGP